MPNVRKYCPAVYSKNIFFNGWGKFRKFNIISIKFRLIVLRFCKLKLYIKRVKRLITVAATRIKDVIYIEILCI